MFIFYKKQLYLLKNKIKNLIFAIKNYYLIKLKKGKKKENSNIHNVDNEIRINNDNKINKKKVQKEKIKIGENENKEGKTNNKKEDINIKKGEKIFQKEIKKY